MQICPARTKNTPTTSTSNVEDSVWCSEPKTVTVAECRENRYRHGTRDQPYSDNVYFSCKLGSAGTQQSKSTRVRQCDNVHLLSSSSLLMQVDPTLFRDTCQSVTDNATEPRFN